MNVEDLQTLSRAGEGQYIEFKKNINHPQQIIEEIVGFANSNGGSLLIGIDDSGTLAGLKFADDDISFLIGYIAKNIRPLPVYTHEIVPLSRKKAVLHLQIESGTEKPYGIISSGTQAAKIFYRVGDKNLQASRELKNILRGSKHDRGQVIRYTDLEDKVLKIISENQPVDKTFIHKHSGFPSRKVSDCLVRLVLAGVLSITPTPEHDLYAFMQQN